MIVELGTTRSFLGDAVRNEGINAGINRESLCIYREHILQNCWSLLIECVARNEGINAGINGESVCVCASIESTIYKIVDLF